MDYLKIRTYPEQFKAVTSLKVEEFDELLDTFDYEWNKYSQKRQFNGKIRKNKPPKKERNKLPTTGHKLFFLLFWYKTNLTQHALGAVFDMEQPMTNKWIRKIEPILHQSLKVEGHLPSKSPEELYRLLQKQQEESKDSQQEQEVVSGHMLLDATERPVKRSIDQERQKEQYSGKKKTHH